MRTNADEVNRAIAALGFASSRFRQLPTEEAGDVYRSVLRHFVPEGDPTWWWEHFPSSTGVTFDGGDGYKYLVKLVTDPEQRVWFIVEESYEVWEASVADIQSLIAECFYYEYYIVQRDLQWLLCETHHNVVFGVGLEVENRLRTFKS